MGASVVETRQVTSSSVTLHVVPHISFLTLSVQTQARKKLSFSIHLPYTLLLVFESILFVKYIHTNGFLVSHLQIYFCIYIHLDIYFVKTYIKVCAIKTTNLWARYKIELVTSNIQAIMGTAKPIHDDAAIE